MTTSVNKDFTCKISSYKGVFMKKFIIITLVLISMTTLSATAWQELKNDGISIINITNIENYKKVTVKMSDTDGLLGNFKGKKIDHEIHSWGIKCDTKESRLLESEIYGDNNQLLYKDEFKYNSWTKIDGREGKRFAQTLYAKVCK